MGICYLKKGALDILKDNISDNIDYYREDTSWLNEYFEGSDFYLPSRIHQVDEINLTLPENGQHFDLENTKKIYTKLKDLTLTQAADERLWVYLTHIEFWEYMKARWDVEPRLSNETNVENFIHNRYFLKSQTDRWLAKNGIARLWWFGYITYDEELDNSFELTEVLFKDQDLARYIVQTSFCRNPMIAKTLLLVLANFNDGKYLKRKYFRNLIKQMNYLGGITVLDALNQEDIKQVIKKKLKELEGKNI